MRKLYDGDTFEVNGATFRVEFEHDDCHGAPWVECDGHGPVTEWERREERRGEWTLNSDRGSRRFYNWYEAMQIAKRDHWGIDSRAALELSKRLGRAVTPRDIRKEAVRRDYEYLHAWCNDEWEYIGVIVSPLGFRGRPTEESESIWGVESIGDYPTEIAHELAEEILGRVNAEKDSAEMRD